jgi:hypothetical protein
VYLQEAGWDEAKARAQWEGDDSWSRSQAAATAANRSAELPDDPAPRELDVRARRAERAGPHVVQAPALAGSGRSSRPLRAVVVTASAVRAASPPRSAFSFVGRAIEGALSPLL